MWGRVKKALWDWDPTRIENKLELGTPDINLAMGQWIELKWVRKMPKNPDRIFEISHYTEYQKTWALRRHHVGGKVFLLLKISSEWLLFYGHVAAENLNKVSLNELRRVAIGRWVKKLNNQELRKLLQE